MKLKLLVLTFLLANIFVHCGKNHPDNNTIKADPNVYISGYAHLDSAVYWNNGKQINLAQAFNTTDIVLSGSDIYVAGNIGFALPGGGGANAAVYWKNGEMIKLGNNPSYANSIAVSGSDVYVCGYAFINNVYVAAYWKNGIIHSLDDTPHSGASSIFVNGNDVYVAGNAGTNGSLAVYWKNDTEFPLEEGTASAIAMNGADLYIAGTTSSGAAYWKNGVKTLLYKEADTTVVHTSATGIAVSGQDVYVIGYMNKIDATYWKNGILTKLNNPLIAMNLSDNKNKIILKGSSVYISLNTADYWKDGKIIHAGNGYASSIAVKQ